MSNAVTSRSVPQTLRLVAVDIKIAHSVFAMPFALLATFMAADLAGDAIEWSILGGQLVLIILAMVFARTVAMLANRIIDRRLDAANPRTADRAIPAGRLSVFGAMMTLVICAVVFMCMCITFGVLYDNWWPTILGPPVLAWISAYGYFKRFTALCHLYLGSSLALSPIAAAIAIAPASIDPTSPVFQPALWLISAMVLCWVAGFDIIYALQDVETDRAQGLHSIPSRIGEKRGLWISRGLHAIAASCLGTAWLMDDRFAILFAIGTGLVIVLLISEHATVARWGTTRIALAFFTLNGVISCVLGGLGIADILL